MTGGRNALVARELAPARLRSSRKTCWRGRPGRTLQRFWVGFAAQREQAPSPQEHCAQCRTARIGVPGNAALRRLNSPSQQGLLSCPLRLPCPQHLANLDWPALEQSLDQDGCAIIRNLLPPAQCRLLGDLYADSGLFRSRVIMARHGFGRGEYQYFRYPLPDLIQQLRQALYPMLVPLANRWNECMDLEARYPLEHAEFHPALSRCRTIASYTAVAAIRTAGLQLSASGSVRRAGIPPAGRDPAVGTGPGLYRRRVCPRRTAPAHAVAASGHRS